MRSIETLMAEGKAKPRRRRRERFAPVLTALLKDLRDLPRAPGDKSSAGDVLVIRLAGEDLRHLGAVARAAWELAESHGFDKPCSCALCRAVWTHLVEPRRKRCRHVYVQAGVNGLLEFEVCKLCGAMPHARGGR